MEYLFNLSKFKFVLLWRVPVLIFFVFGALVFGLVFL